MTIHRRTILTGSAAWAGLAVSGCGGPDAGQTVAVTPATSAASTPVPIPTPAPTPVATPSAFDAVLVQSGDSIGAGSSSSGYAAIDHLGLAAGVSIHNNSVAGRLIADAYLNRARELFAFYDPFRTCVLLLQMGTNDLSSGTAGAALYAKVTAPFVASAKAAGFYVVLNTILPRTWAVASDEGERRTYNDLVRSNSAGADVVDDIASDGLLGDAVDPATSSLYLDGLHPTIAGQQRLAAIYAAILPSVLARVPRTRT